MESRNVLNEWFCLISRLDNLLQRKCLQLLFFFGFVAEMKFNFLTFKFVKLNQKEIYLVELNNIELNNSVEFNNLFWKFISATKPNKTKYGYTFVMIGFVSKNKNKNNKFFNFWSPCFTRNRIKNITFKYKTKVKNVFFPASVTELTWFSILKNSKSTNTLKS